MTSFLPLACTVVLAILPLCTCTPPASARGRFSYSELFKEPKIKKVKAINKSRFTDDEKKLIVDLHNSYRSIVEPSATDMREIEWNDELEEYAYELTQSCTGAHSKRTMVLKRGSKHKNRWTTLTNMNENLYYSFAPDYSIEQALYMFWEEGKDYDYDTGKCTHKYTCAHYLSVVTAENTKVGCAINTCEKFTKSKYPTPANFMACVYDGSYPTYGKPYTAGERCSDCSREKLGYMAQFCRHGLCISPKQHFKDVGFDGDISSTGLL